MTVYTTSGYQLVLGSLELMENDWGQYRFDTLGANATFGNAEPVSAVITSLMTDGDLTTTTRFGNRVAAFDVTITAADVGMLATGEAALMAEIDKVNTLTWHVPFGAPTVFKVVRSWPEHVMDDLAEVQQIERTFRLSFECLPFGRSVDEVTGTWTGPGVELSPLTSITGWTVVSGSAAYDANAGGVLVPGILTSSSGVLRHTVTADEYLWLKVARSSPSGEDTAITGVKVNGTTIADALIHKESFGVNGTTHFYTVPTGAWRGESVTVEFTLTDSSATSAALTQFWSRGYPGAALGAGDASPRGVGVMDTVGSARAPMWMRLTAPAGGVFIYTAPDPNVQIRERGAGESVFAQFTISDPDGDEVSVGAQLMWFPPGTHSTWIGATDPQPLMLNPNGVWPTRAMGLSGGISSWAYPVDGRAAVTFYDTSGAKTIISPSPEMPQGFHGGALAHSVHSVHPGRMGIGAWDVNGDPVSIDYGYHPHWWSHAGQ